MAKINFKLYVLCVFMNVFYVSCKEDTDNLGGEKISLSVPKLTEEENESNHMPMHLRCDACLAVVHQIYTAFFKVNQKKTPLKESDILEILESACGKGFNEYGVKQVNSINRLSGPGLETEKVMGMTQMGGRWPHRLQEMCLLYIGEAGEFDIYDAVREGKENLTKFLCHGKGIYSHCTPMKPSYKTEF